MLIIKQGINKYHFKIFCYDQVVEENIHMPTRQADILL